MTRVKVGILGATGAVGQRFIELLQNHPWFEVTELAASGRSFGKPYREACRWTISGDMPSAMADKIVKECKPDLDCEMVFSALPAEIAGDIEEDFARAGYKVSTNSRNHRMDADVPLVIPEVNPDHLGIIEHQRKNRGWSTGFIVTNPNCSTIAMVLALKPLQDAFGINTVIVTTLQALSGAGYPGVPSLDILDNVIPYIGGEEMKMESETQKLLGTLRDGHFEDARIKVSASCNRVATTDGHLECVSVGLDRKPVSIDEVVNAFASFKALPQELGLPSAPKQPIVVRYELDRPQPKYDRNTGNGYASVVGRIRSCPVLDYKFVVLGHNTIRGAAGGAILNAELLKAQGYLG